jgi:hypothetical protein
MKGKATSKSFNDQYEDNLSKTNSYVQAYYLAEDQHMKEFGGRKYASYDSFRVARSRKKK